MENTNKKRTDGRTAAMVALSLLLCAENADAQEKYNVLFITADDLNCDMGCYDDPLVKTPNLDRLRKHAVRFSNAYCQYPLSGPSRASFMTGYAPDHTRVYNLATNFRKALPDALTLPQLFMANGYTACRVGKIFHAGVPKDIGTPGMDDPQSWHKTYNPIGVDKTEIHKVINHTPERGLGSALCYMVTEGSDDELTDAISANVACGLIRELKKKPFFLALGFYRPHTPYTAPRKYFDLYSMEDIVLPHVPKDDWKNRPVYEKYTNPLNWGVPEKQLKEVKRAYYASISFIDAQIGKVLDTLEEEGLADHTIIVFFSDHGYNLGQHGMWMKQALFEHTTRVPLIISVPGLTQSKEESREIVELLDVYPTLANLCGLEGIPSDLDGNDATDLIRNPETEQDRAAVSMIIRQQTNYCDKATGYSIRTARFRYCEWDHGQKGGELYDYQNDPEERTNLYNHPAFKEIQMKLQKRLHQIEASRKTTTENE